MVRLRRSARAALAAGLVLALGAAVAPLARAAGGDGEGDGVAAASVSVDVVCADTRVPMVVDANAEPAEVVDGGSVTVTWALSLSEADELPVAERLTVQIPLPAEAALVQDVEVTAGSGVVATAWTVADGHLAADLTVDGGPGPVAATVTAPVDVLAGIAPTTVRFSAPDAVVRHLVAGDPAGERCPVDPLEPSLLGVSVAPATPSTTTPPTTPTTGPTTTTTRPSPSTTTTTQPHDPAAGGDVPSATPIDQADLPTVPPGDAPASRVLTADRDGAEAHLGDLRDELATTEADLAALQQRAARVQRRLRHLAGERAALADKLRQRSRSLDTLLAAAYVEAVDAEVTPTIVDEGAVPLATALEQARRTYQRLLGREGEVMAQLGDVAVARADGRRDLDRVHARTQTLRTQVDDGRYQVATIRLGGDLVITGFRFPVAGGHDFSDSWHAPRSGGRLHQGTDIFAAEGTPLRAVERGVLARVGTDDLGGTKLWLVGESGTQYYYAHLSAYASGVADGRVVEAGEVIGYVGHTGNAATTPSHLHFEVHPVGGDAVDAYAMLLAADRAQGGAPATPVTDPAAPTAPTASTVPTTTTAPTTTTTATTTPAAGPDATVTGVTPSGGRVAVIEGRPEVATGWGEGGRVGAGLRAPAAVAVAPDGTVFVADAERDRIVHLAADGALLGEWGASGSGTGDLHEPNGVAVAADGTVYVADTGNDRIQRFTGEGEPLADWGGRATELGRFNQPTGVAVDGDGRVYVVDSLNDRVRVFTAEGRPVRSWGGFGDGDGRFANPTGIAIGADGDVYVADTFNARVQRFTADGRFVAEWRDGLRRPVAVVVAEDGGLVVIDRTPRAIRELDADGHRRGAWGPRGEISEGGGLTLDHPGGLAVDSQGRLLVADTGHGDVLSVRRR